MSTKEMGHYLCEKPCPSSCQETPSDPRSFRAEVGRSAAAVVLLLFGGLMYFKRMERTFADVI